LNSKTQKYRNIVFKQSLPLISYLAYSSICITLPNLKVQNLQRNWEKKNKTCVIYTKELSKFQHACCW